MHCEQLRYRVEDTIYVLESIRYPDVVAAQHDRGGEVIVEKPIGKSVAILFAHHPDMTPMKTTLLRHGAPDDVHVRAELLRQQFMEKGLQNEAQELKVVEGPLPVEALNRIIDTTGYLDRFLREQGLDPGDRGLPTYITTARKSPSPSP